MRTLAISVALTGALALPTPALADSHEEPPPSPPPPALCGGAVRVELLRDRTRFKPFENGFQQQGSLRLRVSDEDSSVELNLPGRLRLADDPQSGVRTIVLSGRNLLLPATDGELAAVRRAGLPDIALVTGRVVLTEGIKPDGSIVPGSERVESFTPRVTDVCALLD